MKAMTRYARTAMTGAQNAGRQEVMQEAVDAGIKVKKCWIATLDRRTREAHQHLDGQVQEVDKPFHSMLGDIMFPGDPDASSSNTWNCRCTLGYEYDEYPQQYSKRRAYAEYIDDDGEAHRESYEIANMTYDVWKKVKDRDAQRALNKWRNQDKYEKAEREIKSGGHISDGTVKNIWDGFVKSSDLIEYDTNVTHGMAEQYLDLIQSFTGNEHIKIREFQRGLITLSEDILYLKPRAEKLEEFIHKATKWTSGITYRAIGLTDDELFGMISSVKRGEIMDMKGTSSWSSSLKVAEEHNISKNNRVIFECKTQKQGASVMAYSNISYEYEVLVSKDSRYKPTEYRKENGITYITLEEI